MLIAAEPKYGMGDSRMTKRTGRASRGKWQRIRRRAGELAMNRGRRADESSRSDVMHAERELLGLQTLPNPDDPSAKKPL